jgi:hypothetical protein
MIYQAFLNIIDKNIEVQKIKAEKFGDEIIKDKLIKFKNGHIIHVNDIGYYNNSNDSAYGYTKEEAVNTIKNKIIEKIEEQKKYIKKLEEELKYLPKEI